MCAGRRGFDTLGHVVLFGVSHHKAASLMISPVPRLFGHFPLSISLCLRALQLQVMHTHKLAVDSVADEYSMWFPAACVTCDI